MTTLKIKLRNPETGKSKTYTQDFVSGAAMYQAFKSAAEFERLQKEALSDTELMDLQLKAIDMYLELISKTFTNEEVNPETILSGLSSEELVPTLMELFDSIMKNEEKKTQTELNKVTK